MNHCSNLSAPLTLTQPCEDYNTCYWKWSRWTVCTTECNGGNTTRLAQCFCDNIHFSVSEEYCNPPLWFGPETVPCNSFTCGQTPAFNKLYWISKMDQIHPNWPMESLFNCSHGYDDVDSPKGQSRAKILASPYPAHHKLSDWYYLAKEWITVELNLANGVQFPQEAIPLIHRVKELLENCSGFTPNQLPLVYSLIEKLNRLNNNIGGLSNVDSQISLMDISRTEEIEPEGLKLYWGVTFLYLVIIVCSAAVIITGVIFGVTLYYLRRKTEGLKEEALVLVEESPLAGDMSKPVDLMLEQPLGSVIKDDSTSEEELF